MIRKLRCISFILFCTVVGLQGVLSQAYTNDWINFSQQYYKLRVVEEGIYRLAHADLVSAGVPISGIDPRRLQLFHRGVEQAIKVQGQNDAVFDPSDYIEFYGKKNDGTLDRGLYVAANAQPHDLYNLFSDTTAYFLTWNLAAQNGKRMTSFFQNNVDGLPAEDYHNAVILDVRTDNYSTGTSYGQYVQLTEFDYGEGWTGVALQENQLADYTLTNIENTYSSGPKPKLVLLLAGRDDKSHNVEILVGPNTSSLRAIGTSQFEDYATELFTKDIEWTDISASGDLTIRVSVLGVSGGNDIASASYIQIIYPQLYDLASGTLKKLTTRINPANNSYLEISNTPSNLTILDITDATNPVEIGYNDLGGSINAMITNTAVPRELCATNARLTPIAIEKVTFQNINPISEYIIISHSSLMKSAGGYSNVIQSYADYRESNAGGSYDAVVLDVQQVFDQFNYGETSPLAIRKLMEYLYDNASPQHLFLIGKALLAGTGGNISGQFEFYRHSPQLFTFQDLVPVAGNPGSDIPYTMGLDGNMNEMTIPVGRLTASSPSQVAAYLDKVKDMESLNFNALWRKNILHLSGGLSSSELVRFAGYMEGYEATAEALYLGGDVTTIKKQSNSTVEFINTTDLINEGLNLITFFGHSAPNITDIDIGYVSDVIHGYNNQSKYPFIFVNGCNAGQIYNNQYLWGEDWLLTENKGAIGFIAHSYFGFESALNNYSNIFYSKAFGDSTLLHKPIGAVQKEVIKQYLNDYGTSERNLSQAKQVILSGDPAVSMFPAEYPDYETNDDNVFLHSFDGELVDALVDSFAIGIIARNFGRADKDSIEVRVQRTLENNTVINYDSTFFPVYYQDTLFITLYNNGEEFAGRNQFSIFIDYNNAQDELNEANNSAFIEANLTLNGTVNLLPYNYAIVSSIAVKIFAQSANVINQSTRDYLYEMDTTNSFDSPFKKMQTVNANILASWEVALLPDISQNDSMVYYWRTKFASPLQGENTEWIQSSFTFVSAGEEGWMQREDEQMVENRLTNIDYNVATKSFEFKSTENNIFAQTYGDNHPTNDAEDVLINIDGLPYIFSSRLCRDNTINLVAFDKESSAPYIGIPFEFKFAQICGRTDQVINNFTYNEIFESGNPSVPISSGNKYLEQYLDAVEDGDYVVLFTIGDVQFDSWSANLVNQLERIGGSSATINALSNGEPYIILGKKGDAAGTALEVTATVLPYNEQTITLDEQITGVYASGNITSSLIGPAVLWGRMEQEVERSEAGIDDFLIDIIGVDFSGIEVALFTDVIAKQVDLTSIDAQLYPYLKLKIRLEDDINQTASQLNDWTVVFEPAAEGILLAGDNVDGYSLVKQEGEKFDTDFQFLNISTKSFTDSLSVKLDNFNKSARKTISSQIKIKAPLPGDTTKFTTTINTTNRVGFNDYSVQVNPYLLPEVGYNNNIINLVNYYEVKQDGANPLVDVLFDGERILDGEIVAPSPRISIQIHDENQFLFKQDTVGIDIFMKLPCETCLFERVAFSSEGVNWTPANDNNDFRIEYVPNRLEDGVYTLRVEAQDASGNESGDQPYEITFEVINESTVTNFYPYPNPFSTSTRFVFTLTGSEIPDQIKIQIMTVSGRIVREITQAELGNIRIGNNLSDFAWDGKDEFGDQLANGVYLYRVIVRSAGETLKQRETSADRAFKHGIGKIYLLR